MFETWLPLESVAVAMKFVDWLMPTETVAGVNVIVWMVFVLVSSTTMNCRRRR
jgi:hypothetical protein